MATTDIVPFGSGGTGTSNVLSQTDYVNFLATLAGNSFQDGAMPSAKQLNKILRQSAFLAAGLANFMVNRGISVPDDGNLANLVAELESSFHAYISKNVAGNTDVTLSPTVEANYPVISLTGALTGNINVIMPQTPGEWLIKNSTTGACTITVKMTTGSGIVVPQGATYCLFSDSVNIMRQSTGELRTIQVFNTAGSFTYTKPSWLIRAKITVVGGGGGGGISFGGGGGGGGTAILLTEAANIGATVSVTVGGPTQTSSFGVLCSATGGASNNLTTGGAGGVGSGGTLNFIGEDGGGSGPSNIGGKGGASMLGVPQAVWTGSGAGGGMAVGYGGGGSGHSGTSGQAGSGIVIVEEFY